MPREVTPWAAKVWLDDVEPSLERHEEDCCAAERRGRAFALAHTGPKSVRCEAAGEDRTGVNLPEWERAQVRAW